MRVLNVYFCLLHVNIHERRKPMHWWQRRIPLVSGPFLIARLSLETNTRIKKKTCVFLLELGPNSGIHPSPMSIDTFLSDLTQGISLAVSFQLLGLTRGRRFLSLRPPNVAVVFKEVFLNRRLIYRQLDTTSSVTTIIIKRMDWHTTIVWLDSEHYNRKKNAPFIGDIFLKPPRIHVIICIQSLGIDMKNNSVILTELIQRFAAFSNSWCNLRVVSWIRSLPETQYLEEWKEQTHWAVIIMLRK